MKFSKRMEAFSSGIFGELNKKKKELEEKGISTIDLSVGSPDRPPAPHIIETLKKEVENLNNYEYAINDTRELREAAKNWYLRRFGVELDPETEIISLIGSQDGLAHISLTIVDPGDVVLVPDPGYPIFSAGPLIAGAELAYMPVLEENDFLIKFEDIDEETAKKAKLMIVSYPSNPVAATAPEEFYQQLVDFAKNYDIAVLHDNAYCELTFDGYRAGSFLQTPGAKDIGVEFNSLSKTYNMAGCRIGFALGNKDIIANLSKLKSQCDYGIFLPIQKAGVAALEGPQHHVRENALIYQRRRDVLLDGLKEAGWNIRKPKATMFVWAAIPEKYSSSMEFTFDLMEKTGVLVTPGVSFGPRGEGFVRIALVQPEEKMKEAVDRIKQSGIF